MKKLISLLLILSFNLGLAAPLSTSEEITIVGRVEGKGSAMRVIRSLEGDALPGMLEHHELEKTLTNLEPGDEVLIKGYVSYESYTLEGGTQLRPIFVVHSLQPVSLKRLGKIDDLEVPERPAPVMSHRSYSPMAIPVSTEVASAITLTTSVLLLQSLTQSPHQLQTKQQLDTGLILFTGAMATGIFIYDQITGK